MTATILDYDAHPIWRFAAWAVIAGCVVWAAWSIRQEAQR